MGLILNVIVSVDVTPPEITVIETVAAPAEAPAMSTATGCFTVEVPPGATGGSIVEVLSPSKSRGQVLVPHGLQPGQTFQVEDSGWQQSTSPTISQSFRQ